MTCAPPRGRLQDAETALQQGKPLATVDHLTGVSRSCSPMRAGALRRARPTGDPLGRSTRGKGPWVNMTQRSFRAGRLRRRRSPSPPPNNGMGASQYLA